MIVSILMILLSLVLVFQGLCNSGVLPFSVLVLDKFSTNNFLLLIRTVLTKYSVLLGVLGIVLGIYLFVLSRRDKDSGTSISYWGLIVSYALVNIFILI